MAAIIATDWEAGLAITGAATPYSTAAQKPLFEAGQTVFNKDDFTHAAASNPNVVHVSYTIDSIVLIPQTEGGVTKLMDQTQTFATSCDMSTARTFEGWQHTTTPAATRAATTTSNPFFYNITSNTGEKLYNIHQAKLTDQSSIETYVPIEFPGWWG